MSDSTDHIISMLLPIIAENFLSFDTLNLLARTNKVLRVAVADPRVAVTVAKNVTGMTSTMLRKLFVLPRRIWLPGIVIVQCLDRTVHFIPQLLVLHAFNKAMVVHGSMSGMQHAFHVRNRRSAAMKLVWKQKKELLAAQKETRRCEIDKIHSDLCIIPSSDHERTPAELDYEEFGITKRLGRVYCSKRLMALHTAGILNVEGLDPNTFLRVALIDMTYPDTLTHTERLFVLRHNIAWEHYLFNYTDFCDTLVGVLDMIADVDHIEFLFELPSKWPWVREVTHPPVADFEVADFEVLDLPLMFEQWTIEHTHLYEEV
jgi:hypothetical protein